MKCSGRALGPCPKTPVFRDTNNKWSNGPRRKVKGTGTKAGAQEDHRHVTQLSDSGIQRQEKT